MTTPEEIKNAYIKFYEMVNEYAKLDASAKKEYLVLVTTWLMREKDIIIFEEEKK